MILWQTQILDNIFITLNKMPSFLFYNVTQVHGTNIVDIDTINKNDQADGIIFDNNLQKIPAIITADCIPLLIIGENKSILLHAGHQGIRKKIIDNKKVKEIVPNIFIIGPHIKKCCYEVQQAFLDNFEADSNFIKKSGKLYFDMETELCDQINDRFKTAKIITGSPCTCCNEQFYSYRRDQTTKRNWNLLVPSTNIL